MVISEATYGNAFHMIDFPDEHNLCPHKMSSYGMQNVFGKKNRCQSIKDISPLSAEPLLFASNDSGRDFHIQ